LQFLVTENLFFVKWFASLKWGLDWLQVATQNDSIRPTATRSDPIRLATTHPDYPRLFPLPKPFSSHRTCCLIRGCVFFLKETMILIVASDRTLQPKAIAPKRKLNQSVYDFFRVCFYFT